MKNKKALLAIGFSALMITSLVINTKAGTLEWRYENNKAYWYEDNIKQGTYDDAKGVIGDGTVRGREIYDPESDGWYWLDACYDGAKAVNKEVWMPYVYQDEKNWNEKEILANANASGLMANQVKETIKNGEGKWVRYDANGKMVKGWYTVDDKEAEIYPEQKGNTYYYDAKTGLMAKGKLTIAGDEYTFDTITGVLIEKKEHTHLEPETPESAEPTTPAPTEPETPAPTEPTTVPETEPEPETTTEAESTEELKSFFDAYKHIPSLPYTWYGTFFNDKNHDVEFFYTMDNKADLDDFIANHYIQEGWTKQWFDDCLGEYKEGKVYYAGFIIYETQR